MGCVCVPVLGYVCAVRGFRGAQSELELGPMVRGTVEEVMRPSRKPCASVALKSRRERTCCGIEAT